MIGKGDFSSYAAMFKQGKVPFGDYWYHLEVWLLFKRLNLFKALALACMEEQKPSKCSFYMV